jgi:glycosyltransferase involved in cell wall biosynthesis
VKACEVDFEIVACSAEVLRTLLPRYPGFRTIRVEKNVGYGFGILSGLKAAKGDVLGWTHADLQTDPMDSLKALSIFQDKGQNIFVKGRRFGRPMADLVFTVGMSLFESAFLLSRLWDINAQPTFFTRKFFESWRSPPHDFSLDLYAYYMARRSKLQVHRFPVHFGSRIHGVSSWNVNWAAKKKFIERTINYSIDLRRSLKNEDNRS